MAIQELETAVRLRLPLLVVVYDDAAYGAEVHHFGPHGQDVDLARFPDSRHRRARARVRRRRGLVRAVADLARLGDWLARRDRPLLVDAKVNPDVCAEWLEEAFRSH